MEKRVILLGATGYTGRLVAASLVEMGERPVLAGRTASRLREMADSLAGSPGSSQGSLETVVADVTRPESVREIVAVSKVSPFGHAMCLLREFPA